MKCKRCGKDLDYEVAGENEVKPTAIAQALRPFFAVSLQMQGVGWNEQLSFYLCSKCYTEVKTDIMGGK